MTSNEFERSAIKTARPEDIDRIQRLYNHNQIKKELHWYTYRDGLERAVSNEGRDILFTDDNETEEVIGASMVWCESRVLKPGQAQVRLIAVHPDFRSTGLGADLIEASENYAKEAGKTVLIAETAASSDAKQFWLTMDFQVTSTRTTDGGREMALMKKEI
ncbi:GNAT family N-acetyltransferase [Halogeometricum limi]|uniref:Ribosomal protein S18 acetylase RimI n=1 Tax=Halogeometricum limi TaxID=555875 RepID=A0A1I6HV22_9EURY|nr:GNAT family N-acetyltransferase [Halogeometricum limi]SFR58284.1 Ribosomal protein S18 acetylase RimI [Halogeometricum limi]